MGFEWDFAKSEENERKRGVPFALAILLFDGGVLQTVDDRRDDGERRIRVIGSVDGTVLHCVYTDRGLAAVNLGGGADVHTRHVLVVAAFRNDDPKLTVNGYQPLAAHGSGPSMVPYGRISRISLK